MTTARLALWKVATIAFVAMVVEEAHYNWVAAGTFDVLGWITGLVCSALAIESIISNGWRNKRSLTLIAAVSLANFWGTGLGVWMAAALTHHH